MKSVEAPLKIKVCGITNAGNMQAVAALRPALLGFIFYAPSRRSVLSKPNDIFYAPAEITKVGVFVDEELATVRQRAGAHGIHTLQLHGQESPAYCQGLKDEGYTVMKVFGVDNDFDFANCAPYSGIADFLLFDTRTKSHGGSGEKFDWAVLSKYKGNTPFFLSGGIDPADAEAIKNLQHAQLYGLDLNSRFESTPGIKDVEQLRLFMEQLTTENIKE
jgi:phosphoribosylanthranilate isomerase